MIATNQAGSTDLPSNAAFTSKHLGVNVPTFVSLFLDSGFWLLYSRFSR
jgi:hypothetical protein